MLIAGPQLRAARAMARLEQTRLAELAGVTPITIIRLESESGLLNARGRTLRALQRALEQAGVEFTDADKPGVRMREYDDGSSPAIINAAVLKQETLQSAIKLKMIHQLDDIDGKIGKCLRRAPCDRSAHAAIVQQDQAE